MTLSTVDCQHVTVSICLEQQAAVFMTTLLEGFSCSHTKVSHYNYYTQRQVYVSLLGGLASFFLLLPILSCVPYTQFPIRSNNLSLSLNHNIAR